MNDSFHRTIADLAALLRREKVPFAVIGGIAEQALTQDLVARLRALRE